ncbi:hypothetical protein ACRDNQ_08165 [Palleronia sp. KMU-117]|uniref:hypothetical protein n=1 Tax=Palleronia sp. KMU-117 TaxID=3434108 RepID=UPI003D731189
MIRSTAGVAALVLLAACAPSSGPSPASNRAAAVGLVPDALGLQPNGTALRIDFGRAEPGMIPAVSRLLGEAPAFRGAVAGCALTAARWDNGLTLWFDRGSFVGWTEVTGASAGRVCAAA